MYFALIVILVVFHLMTVSSTPKFKHISGGEDPDISKEPDSKVMQFFN